MNIVKQLKYLLIDQFTFWGGGKGGGTPDPPDPYAVAGATTQTNNQTAAYNKALNLNNYSNPFGSQQSEQVGTDPKTGAPIYNTSVSADPQLQQALSSLLGQTGQSAGVNASALNNLGAIAGGYNTLNANLASLGSSMDMNAVQAAQQQGQDAAYKSQTQYLDPQFSQGQSSLQSQLANQGLTPGSQAYNNAMLNFNNQKQQAYSNAQNQSILTGSQIGAQNLQNQLSGINTQAGLLGQQGANFGQQAGLLGQQVGISQLPYSNLGSIASLIPGYAGPAQSSSSPANIGQNVYSNYQAQMNNYNAQQQSQNQFTGGLFGLGSAGILGLALAPSDRRLKKRIGLIRRNQKGFNEYAYRYIWEPDSALPRIGVMADEIKEIMPEAVVQHPLGFDMVNYAMLEV